MEEQEVLHLAKVKMPQELAFLSAVFKDGFAKSKTINYKTNFKDLVTETDKKIESAFMEWLKINFPDHELIGEENSNLILGKSDWKWCIDPVDGTTNFVHGIPNCAIIISVLHKDKPMMCWMAFPLLDKLYFAQKDNGVYVNGKKLPKLKHVSLKDSLLTTVDLDNFQEFQKMLASLWKKVSGIRIDGCVASAYCQVVSGQVQLAILPNCYLWEYSAGFLLIEEIGGQISTLEGNKLGYASIKENIVISCSKALMSEVQKHLIK